MILSTREDLPLDEVRLNGALEESVAAFYAALTARGITPDIRITEKPIIRRLNRAALSRVFSNLLNNALAYSDGDLEVALTDGGEAVFTNTAAGLDDLQVGRLFDRFFSVEAARNSTGLGLAISRTLVEQMNGTIRACTRTANCTSPSPSPTARKGRHKTSGANSAKEFAACCLVIA